MGTLPGFVPQFPYPRLESGAVPGLSANIEDYGAYREAIRKTQSSS